MADRRTKGTKVVLADDDAVFLRYIARLLEPRFEIVGAFLDGDAVLRKYPLLNANLLILDISMGRVSGLQVAQRLFLSGYQPKTVFVTIHEEPELVHAALALGASAYVLKSRLRADLNPAIEAALAGQTFISATLLAKDC
jgi:DNA-binding NarL/FixJ family response regulator